MGSTAVAASEETGVVVHSEAELAELAGAIRAKTKQSDIVLPLARLVQPMSKAAEDQSAKAGEFINSLTGDNYGTTFDFIVAGHFYGVAYSNREEDFFAAIPGDANTVIPSSWPHPDAGKRFGESDAFEERFKALVNSGEREWGDGPQFSITYNFVGYLPGESGIPLRLSLMRTSAPAAKKLLSMLSFDRYPWSHQYTVSSRKIEENGNRYWVAEIVRGETIADSDTGPIVELALSIHRASDADFVLYGDDGPAEKPAGGKAKPAPKAEGSLDLG